MNRLVLFALLVLSVAASAADGVAVVMPLQAAEPDDNFTDKELKALDAAFRTSATRELKALHFAVVPLASMVESYGALVSHRSSCSAHRCQLAIARQLRSEVFLTARVSKKPTGFELGFASSLSRTGATLRAEGVGEKTLAKLGTALTSRMKGFLRASELTAAEKELLEYVTGREGVARPTPAAALVLGDPVPPLGIRLDNDTTLSPTTGAKSLAILFFQHCHERCKKLSAALLQRGAPAVVVPMVSAASFEGERSSLALNGLTLPVARDGGALALAYGVVPTGADWEAEVVVVRPDGRVGGLLRGALGRAAAEEVQFALSKADQPMPDGKVVGLKPEVLQALKQNKERSPGPLTVSGAERLRAAILQDGQIDAAEVELIEEYLSGGVVLAKGTALDNGAGAEPGLIVRGVTVGGAHVLRLIDTPPEPALVDAWEKGRFESLTELQAKGAEDARRVQRVLRERLTEALVKTSALQDHQGLRELVTATAKRLEGASPERATATKRMVGSELADLDVRSADSIPDFVYDWLLK